MVFGPALVLLEGLVQLAMGADKYNFNCNYDVDMLSIHEGNSLRCRPGRVLHIFSAMVDSQDGKVDKSKPIKSRCFMKPSCTIPVQDRVLSFTHTPDDPKVLYVAYACRSLKSSEANENMNVVVECYDNSTVNVYSAKYGPSGPRSKLNSTCQEADKLTLFKEKCEEKPRCSINASNVKMGGNPCTGQPKKLKVEYACLIDCNKRRSVLPSNVDFIKFCNLLCGQKPCWSKIGVCELGCGDAFGGYRCEKESVTVIKTAESSFCNGVFPVMRHNYQVIKFNMSWINLDKMLERFGSLVLFNSSSKKELCPLIDEDKKCTKKIFKDYLCLCEKIADDHYHLTLNYTSSQRIDNFTLFLKWAGQLGESIILPYNQVGDDCNEEKKPSKSPHGNGSDDDFWLFFNDPVKKAILGVSVVVASAALISGGVMVAGFGQVAGAYVKGVNFKPDIKDGVPIKIFHTHTKKRSNQGVSPAESATDLDNCPSRTVSEMERNNKPISSENVTSRTLLD